MSGLGTTKRKGTGRRHRSGSPDQHVFALSAVNFGKPVPQPVPQNHADYSAQRRTHKDADQVIMMIFQAIFEPLRIVADGRLSVSHSDHQNRSTGKVPNVDFPIARVWVALLCLRG